MARFTHKSNLYDLVVVLWCSLIFSAFLLLVFAVRVCIGKVIALIR